MINIITKNLKEYLLISISGEATIENISRIKSEIKDILEINKKIILDLEGISGFDYTFIQLLNSLLKTSQKEPIEIKIKDTAILKKINILISDVGILNCKDYIPSIISNNLEFV